MKRYNFIESFWLSGAFMVMGIVLIPILCAMAILICASLPLMVLFGARVVETAPKKYTVRWR